MSEHSENPYQPRNRVLRLLKRALREVLVAVGPGRSLVARYPKLKEHAIMYWMRLRRAIWPWMRGPWKLRMAKPGGTGITSRVRWDGAGSQVLATLSNICFVEVTGLRYVHTPFFTMAHAPDGMSDEKCAAMWEQHLQLGKGMRQLEDAGGMRRISVRGPQYIRNLPDVLYEIDNCHSFTDRYPETWQPTLERIKRERWTKPIPERDRVWRVAGHARRGDVPPTESLRYTSNAQLVQAFSSIRETLRSLSIECELHLYSEGAEDGFQPLKPLSATLHLNGDQISDWDALRSADVLLVSRSAYSYSAALLSDGIIICPRFWHEPLPGWVRVDEHGMFDTEGLARRIRDALSD